MFRAALISVLIGVASSGCSKFVPKLDEVIPDNRKNYEKSQSLPDLEVPPDLSTEAIRDRMAIPEGGEAARYSTYQERQATRQKTEQLEQSQNSAIRVLENEHVLAVDGAAVQIWPKLKEFWASKGYTLELDDVELGVVETAWTEDDAKLSRDKFKVFAEAGEKSGTTVLYVSHEGQELVPQGEDLVWQRKPRDAEREGAIVDELQAFLSGSGTAVAAASDAGTAAAVVGDTGTATDADAAAAIAGIGVDVSGAESSDAAESDQPATDEAPATPGETATTVGEAAPVTTGPQHAELVSVGGGKVYLSVAEDFPSAWKTTGRALEKAGVSVRDSDKGRGVYVIEMGGGEDDSGMLDKLKFWGSDNDTQLQISLTGVGEKTEVVVLDRDGRWETGDVAGELLGKLQDALNSGRI